MKALGAVVGVLAIQVLLVFCYVAVVERRIESEKARGIFAAVFVGTGVMLFVGLAAASVGSG
jgi:hypothetical protein